MTPEGRAELQAEASRLVSQRDALARGEEPARSARRGELDRKLALVEAALTAATVLGPDSAPEGVAGFGCWVTVEDAGGARTTWRLVGPDEVDVSRKHVSVESPLGAALLGHAPGDSVEVERPAGMVEFTVIAVRREPP